MPKHHDHLRHLREVSDLIVDPHVERSQNQIRRVNNLSINGMLEDDALESAVEEFNKLWPYHGELMVVSGKVHERGGGYGDEYAVTIKDRMAISYGFDMNIVDGATVVGHHLGIIHSTDQEDDDAGSVEESFSAWADPSDIFLDPLEIDTEKAAKLFSYHYPEAFKEIEARILNSSEGCGETRNEIDVAALESLGGVVIEHDVEKGDAQEDRNMISKYLEHMLPLNQANAIPYSIAFKGVYYPTNPETGSIDINHAKNLMYWHKSLATPHKILLIPQMLVDSKLEAKIDYNKSIVAIYMHISDIDGKKPEAVEPLVIPVGDNLIMDPNVKFQRFESLE